MFRSIHVLLIMISIAASGFARYAPAASTATDGPASMADEEHKQAFVAAMAPQRPGRPVIAIMALNEGTEMTDLMLPHAVLKRADVADVKVVAPHAGPVKLYPALQIQSVQDFSAFDRRYPEGADYVIVPAMSDDDNPAVIAWLKRQARLGARVIGVCVGARVVGRAGLLDGRRFAGHWYDRDTLLERHPGAVHVPDRRYVVDRGVATTTGITASLPTMLALVQAIGGEDKARSLAAELGVASWAPTHNSDDFGLNFRRGVAYALNKAAFWRDERWAMPLQDGMDDIPLALALDAWSRTGHITIDAVSDSGPVSLRSGLILTARPHKDEALQSLLSPGAKPMEQLDRTLTQIAERYGVSRRDWVMQEMEYAGSVQ